MKKSQILILLLFLVTGHGVHAALPKEEHWLEYNNPFDNQFDGQLQFHGDSFQQAINQKDEHGNTFLRHAVIKYNIKKVKRLIEFGADVNSQCRCGNTNLHLAVYRENEQMVQLLLDADADVNQQNLHGETPLHLAVARNVNEIAQLLVNAGADVNKQDLYGDTPLHWSIKASSVVYAKLHEKIKLLVAAGADTTITNEDGYTARELIFNNLIRVIFDKTVGSQNTTLKRNYDNDNVNDSDSFNSKKRKIE